jgi:hypothetical protein
MKKKTTSIMLTACAAALVSFGVWSCSKDHSNSTPGTTLTESNAAQVTTDAVAPATGGLVAQIHSAAALSANVTTNSINHKVVDALPCGSTKDTTITYASVSGVTPSFSYSLGWSYSLQCTVPAMLDLNFTGSGTYNGLVINSQFNSTGAFKLTGLDSLDYTYNSTFSRSGTIHSKTNSSLSYDHVLTITSTNIKYNTTTQEIASGTATVNVRLINSAGGNFTFSGTITFLGNKTARLVLNSGTAYTISWT